MNPLLPQLDEPTAQLAAVFARDSDHAGRVIAALLVHGVALETAAKALQGRLDKAESQVLETARQASLAEQDRLARQVSVCASPVPGAWSA